MTRPKDNRRFKLVTTLIETFGFSPWLATLVASGLVLAAAAVVLWLWLSAPPREFTITSGPVGSSFQRNAESYRERLAKHGYTLKIVPSNGSLDNLQRLKKADSGVDLGFVQGGLVGDPPPEEYKDLVSLGSVAYQPLWVFYRSETKVTRLSELAGKRIGIGAPGSGVYVLAKTLLEANGITGAPTTLVEQASEDAGKDFQAGKLDALFLMGDSAPTATLRTLIRAPGVQILNFAQADAYVRRMSYLNKIVIPQGGIDFGQNLPAQDITLIGPTVELIARRDLNSAISDVVLSVAQDVHDRGTLTAKKGEFPKPVEHELPISDDAQRFYKSGLGFTYKLVHSFWLANLTTRLLVVIVPLILVIVPAIRFLPVLYRWSVLIRIYRCYRPLLRLERELREKKEATDIKALFERLDAIEQDVRVLKVPASFAQQFYDLQAHVVFVRQRLKLAAEMA